MSDAEADEPALRESDATASVESTTAPSKPTVNVHIGESSSSALASGLTSSSSLAAPSRELGSNFLPEPLQGMSEHTAGLLERLKLPKTEVDHAHATTTTPKDGDEIRPIHTHSRKSRTSSAASAAFALESAPSITRVNAAGQRLYCVCNEPYDENNAAESGESERPAVCCVSCEDWFVEFWQFSACAIVAAI